MPSASGGAPLLEAKLMKRISTTHLLFLVIVSAVAIILNYNALRASDTLYNLIVVLPSGILVLGLAVAILIHTLLKGQEGATEPSAEEKSRQYKTLLGDIVLLALFAFFCAALTRVGFDVATFLFVWFGILLGGTKNWIIPPIYAAIFTFVLIKTFGELFPFPMPLMVF